MAPTTTSAKASKRRIQILVTVFVGAFLVLGFRAAWLGAVRSSNLSAKADRQHLSTVTLAASRGTITSSDGRPLAVDRPTVTVTADARYVEDPADVAATIASVTGGKAADRARLEAALRSRSAYIVLAKNISIPRAEYLKKLDMAGVHFTKTATRAYPLRKVAGQILGFTNTETGKGIEGLEAKLDDVLAGHPGERTEIRDPHLRQTVRIVDTRSPEPGTDVELTINADLQEKLETEVVAARTKYGAKGAIGMIMDPNNGAILAMTSVPRIDPGNRRTLDPAAVPNRAVTDPYEPGSVFKVVPVAGALEDRRTTPNEKFAVPPKLVFSQNNPDEFTIHDAHRRSETKIWTTEEILQQSSNIGTLMISGRLVETNRLRWWMDRFGIGAKTGIDMGHESAGVLPGGDWNQAQVNNIPIGQGVSTTQVQLMRAFSAIANGGCLVTPHIVARIDGHSVTPKKGACIISKRTSRQMTDILKTVIEGSDGTAAAAALENYEVAGKTGTAQKVEGGRYVERYRSSFIGYVPADRPKLLISVMIDDPDTRGPHTGGAIAAPVFRSVADYALSSLGIAP